MTSYEERLKQFTSAIDSKESEAFPRTSSYTKTVGFGSTPPTTGTTPPVSIPKVSPGTSIDKEFMGYKSQLQGWSDSSEGTLPPSSPKSLERKAETVKPTTPPGNSTRKSSQAPLPQDIEVKKQPTEKSSVPSAVPVTGLSAVEKARIAKAERRAQYEAEAKKKQEKKLQGKEEGGEQPKKESQQQKKKGDGQQQQQQQQQPKKEKQPQQQKVKEAPKDSAQPAVQVPKPKPTMQFDDSKKRVKAEKKKMVLLQPSQKQVSLFSHLPQYEKPTSLKLNVGFSGLGDLHPAILELGLKYAQSLITGSNARCVAMLTAFKKVIEDYNSTSGVLFKDLDIKPLVQFLVDCRPMSISMGNAINYLKLAIAATKTMDNQEEAKEFILEKIDRFIQERILVADEVIAKTGVSKIVDGDVILTYARSHVVEMIITQAQKEGKKFRVVVVDSRPKREGKELLRRLVKAGVKCTFVLISAISYIMPEVTKVFVGAYTMMANGNLISRCGTALIAMMAHAFHIPFIVCCETYKFSERVQLESISFNELGDPDELLSGDFELEKKELLQNWKDIPNLKLLNLVYDLTPSEYIVMVITEIGLVPASSVPVILREYHKEPSEL